MHFFLKFHWGMKALIEAHFHNKARASLIFYAFCGTFITVGAQYATLTLSRSPGASIE